MGETANPEARSSGRHRCRPRRTSSRDRHSGRPDSSLRPSQSETRRWGQNSSSSPIRPSLSRKATSSSPSSCTRTGAQSGSGNSEENERRNPVAAHHSPIGVPGSVLVTNSFSSRVNMLRPPLLRQLVNGLAMKPQKRSPLLLPMAGQALVKFHLRPFVRQRCHRAPSCITPS